LKAHQIWNSQQVSRALSYVSATSRRDITRPGSISIPGKATRPTYVASPGGAES